MMDFQSVVQLRPTIDIDLIVRTSIDRIIGTPSY